VVQPKGVANGKQLQAQDRKRQSRLEWSLPHRGNCALEPLPPVASSWSTFRKRQLTIPKQACRHIMSYLAFQFARCAGHCCCA
jgi:hypothetical protein